MGTFGKIGPTTLLNKKPFAREYVQNGLLMLYDARENAGFEQHDPTATTWQNLAKPGEYGLVKSGTGRWAYNALVVSGYTAKLPKPSNSISKNNTYEIVFAESGNYSGALLHFCTTGYLSICMYYHKLYSYTQPYNNSSRYIDCSKIPFGVMTTASLWGLDRADAAWSTCFRNAEQVSTTGNGPSWSNQVAINYLTVGARVGGAANDNLDSLGTANGMLWYGKIYCIRMYNRKLSADEILHNHLVDGARFHVPVGGGNCIKCVTFVFYTHSSDSYWKEAA